MTATQQRASPMQAYLLLALAGLCWSGNHVLGRAIAGHVPPITLSALRWVLPVVLLWPFARTHLKTDWPAIRRHWPVMLLLGLSGGAVFSALQYVGLQYTTAVNVSVLNSLGPVLIVLAVALVFRETMRGAQLAGLALSLVGVLVIVTRGDLSSLAQLSLNRGDLIILFNMCVWALYCAFLRLRPPIHWTSFIFLLALIAAVSTAPFAVIEHMHGTTLVPDTTTLLAFLYVSIFPSLVAYASWNRGVELIGANRAGTFLHLIPLYSAVLAGLLLGETIGLHHIAGFVLILAGVWLAVRPSH